jgi:hypothetical protein
MRPLSLIELQCVSDAVDDALRDAGGVAALEPDVVLARDTGKDGGLIAAQARDPPAASRGPWCKLSYPGASGIYAAPGTWPGRSLS